MDRKVLALLLIFLMSASALTPGCAGRRDGGAGAPSVTPTATAATSPTALASTASVTPSVAAAPTVTPTPVSPGSPSGSTSFDPSLADISGEGIDEGGFPETGLPTPTLD